MYIGIELQDTGDLRQKNLNVLQYFRALDTKVSDQTELSQKKQKAWIYR